MIKKSTPKFLKYTLLLLMVLLCAMWFLRKNHDEEIDISKAEWNCDYLKYSWRCEVTYKLKNKTNTPQVGRVGVRGLSRNMNKKLTLDELSQISYVPFNLKAFEEKNYLTEIKAKRKPKKIMLSFIEKDNIY